MRTGTANLPLHYGKAPRWLFSRMVALSKGVITAFVSEYNPEFFLQRLSDPYWFQALGCVLGFDWHSSGITTTVCGAIKEALKQIDFDSGIFAAGGKGSVSRKTPEEIFKIAANFSLDTEPSKLAYASRMTAKVDSSCLQDGFQIYHHNIFFTASGKWCVVQQGMNENSRLARRYHWMNEDFKSYVVDPHKAICCNWRGDILNLTASETKSNQEIMVELFRQDPEKSIKQLNKLKEYNLPLRHKILLSDLNSGSIKRILLKNYEQSPVDFEALAGTKQVGAKTLRALSLIADLIYGAPCSFRDPVKFSFAHGGKDGTPYPVDKQTYDQSIDILNKILNKVKIDHTEKIKAFKRLKDYRYQTSDLRLQTSDTLWVSPTSGV